MMDLAFTKDEIREELAKLGYSHVPEDRLQHFQDELNLLMHSEESHDTSISSRGGPHTSPLSNRRYRTDDQSCSSSNHPETLSDHRPHHIHIHRPVTNDVPFQPDVSTDETISECGSERRALRRKTLRKAEDGSHFIDESITESEPGSLSSLDERLRELGMYHPYNIADDVIRDRDLCRRPGNNPDEAPYRLDVDDNRPASVILRPAEHPHTRNLNRCDPVMLYHQYRRSWSSYQTPAERLHKGLRWAVRENMLYQDEVVEKRQHKVFVPNSYVVPTDKKRQALRWQVRTSMALGKMPTSDADFS